MEKNIKVIVRVRPFSRRELESNQRLLVRVVDETTMIFDPDEDIDEFFFQGVKQNFRDITKRVNKKQTMEYDNVFDAEATNSNVFETGLRPLIMSVMNGFNCSVFVYGSTGAGKTHTMLGNENCPGVTFLTIRALFQQMEELSDERKFEIGASYLEVYNEQIMNLLTKSGPLKLREDSNGVVVGGLTLKKIENAQQLFDLLILGNRNRTQHPTDANAESSRSHAIFQVHIRMTDLKTTQKRTVKLSMIDLAGSERAASTKCMGLRFKEGASINKSLLALGNCINSLADGLKHIPYRDSNLTRILKDSLGGNCQTVMIANVSPSSLTYEDTYNTLKYASRAKNIRTKISQNIIKSNMPKEFYIKKVTAQLDENEKLKNQIRQLEGKLQVFTSQEAVAVEKVAAATVNYDSPEIDRWFTVIEEAFTKMKNAQQNFLGLQSKDKILCFRTHLKQEAEKMKSILKLDGVNLEKDIAKLEASIDKYGQEQVRQKDEMNVWKKRYVEAKRVVEGIRNDFNGSPHKRILQLFFQTKEQELENVKMRCRETHTFKIQKINDNEIKNHTNIIPLCLEIIQQNYLLLKARNLDDIKTKKKLESLAKMIQGNRAVKFSDEIDVNDKDYEHLSLNLGSEEMTFVVGGGFGSERKRTLPTSFDNDCDILVESKKNKVRLFRDVTVTSSNDLDENVFLNPNQINFGKLALDETRILTSDSAKLETTFQVPQPTVLKSMRDKNILTERNINNHPSAGLKKVMKHTVARPIIKKAMVTQENRKISPIKRKSPRSILNPIKNRAFPHLKNHQRTNTNGSSDSTDSDSARPPVLQRPPIHLKKKINN